MKAGRASTDAFFSCNAAAQERKQARDEDEEAELESGAAENGEDERRGAEGRSAMRGLIEHWEP